MQVSCKMFSFQMEILHSGKGKTAMPDACIDFCQTLCVCVPLNNIATLSRALLTKPLFGYFSHRQSSSSCSLISLTLLSSSSYSSSRSFSFSSGNVWRVNCSQMSVLSAIGNRKSSRDLRDLRVRVISVLHYASCNFWVTISRLV